MLDTLSEGYSIGVPNVPAVKDGEGGIPKGERRLLWNSPSSGRGLAAGLAGDGVAAAGTASGDAARAEAGRAGGSIPRARDFCPKTKSRDAGGTALSGVRPSNSGCG
jgi:hypothetical protein